MKVMNNDQLAESLFRQSRPALPPGLSRRVFSAIEQKAFQRVQLRVRVASWCAFSSLTAFFAILFAVGGSFFSSDFWSVGSLVFTDLSLVLSFSEEFFLSLTETFPAASATVLLVPLFLYAVSLLYRSRYLDLLMQRGSFQLNVIR